MKPSNLAVLPFVVLVGCTSQMDAWTQEFVGQPVEAFVNTGSIQTGVTVDDTMTYTIPVGSPVQPVSFCDRIVTARNGIIQTVRSTCWYDNV